MRLEARSALYCHEFLHKSFAPNRFDLSLRITEDPVADEYKRMGDVHEASVIERIKGSSLRYLQIDKNQTDEAKEIETAKALLRSDLDVIFGATISSICESELRKYLGERCKGDDERVSRPDVLVKVGERYGFAEWSPVDIKSHGAFDSKIKSSSVDLSDVKTLAALATVTGRIDKNDALQLAHYFLHLTALGLAPSKYLAGIIGSDGNQIAWSDLAAITFGRGNSAANAITTYLEKFSEAKAIIGQSLEHARSETAHVDAMAMVQPDSVYGCDRCEFRNVCLKEMHEYRDGGGHLTLLATVTPSKLENFPDDIESIADLVEATGLDGFAATSQIRGRVWQTKKPELLNPSEPLNIPEFDIEIDIDLENSQAALGEQIQDSTIGQDLVYLYGFGIHDRTLSKDWRSATIESVVNFDNTSEAEYEILSRTWHLLTSQIELALEQGKTLGIFHYSHYEKIWWRRYVSRHEGKPGVPSLEEVERIMATYFVDLQPLATRVSFPTMNYSVKSLAKVAGFTWSADDAGGAMSLLKYKLATSSEVAIEEQEAAKQWLIEYNLDDVRATFAVRDYLRSLEL